ncbi:pimeloyl-ACP methyl ester carboxylesterase [Arthrobacter sp. CG_A4]|nr:pimeloyl-ACP methyl ester carboxylesterase [Arthrobacter sp. CG_A4]
MYGVSQGGWVALIAAALDARVRFVISNSGPGVSPAYQDRFRILNDLRQDGQDGTALTEAGRWLYERADRLLAGQFLEDVLASQESFKGSSWYHLTTRYFDTWFLSPKAWLRSRRCSRRYPEIHTASPCSLAPDTACS